MDISSMLLRKVKNSPQLRLQSLPIPVDITTSLQTSTRFFRPRPHNRPSELHRAADHVAPVLFCSEQCPVRATDQSREVRFAAKADKPDADRRGNESTFDFHV